MVELADPGTDARFMTSDSTTPHGTPETRARSFASDSLAVLDVPRWLDQLRVQRAETGEDRASALLLRQPPVRVLLTSLLPDAEIGSEGADETLLLLVVAGSTRVTWRDQEATLSAGEAALIPAGGGWIARSEAAETVLLTTFWGTPGTGDPTADPSGRDQPVV
jgi:quercetin dioxygenase-like cupin family protein